jgi:hypothetical protein
LVKSNAKVRHCCGPAGMFPTPLGEIATLFWSPETPLAPAHLLMFPFCPISQQFDNLVLTWRPPPPRVLRAPLRNVAGSDRWWRPHSQARRDVLRLVRPSASSRNHQSITSVHLQCRSTPETLPKPYFQWGSLPLRLWPLDLESTAWIRSLTRRGMDRSEPPIPLFIQWPIPSIRPNRYGRITMCHVAYFESDCFKTNSIR